MNAPCAPRLFAVPQVSLLARMEPDELKHIMRYLACRSDQALGDKIGVSHSAVCSWRNGKVGVPRHIAMLLRLLAAECRL